MDWVAIACIMILLFYIVFMLLGWMAGSPKEELVLGEIQSLSSVPRPMSGSVSTPIPKVLLQVTKSPQPAHVVRILRERTGHGWLYLNMTDHECLEYMRFHSIDKITDPVKRFSSFHHGPHKADYFRYYFLYLNGGVFVDGDLLPLVSLPEILQDGDRFITIKTYHDSYNAVFNGFIAVAPRHPIMHEALQRLHQTPDWWLRLDYMKVCRDLHAIVHAHVSKGEPGIRVLQERNLPHKGYAETLGEQGQVLFRHYYKTKAIPYSP